MVIDKSMIENCTLEVSEGCRLRLATRKFRFRASRGFRLDLDRAMLMSSRTQTTRQRMKRSQQPAAHGTASSYLVHKNPSRHSLPRIAHRVNSDRLPSDSGFHSMRMGTRLKRVLMIGSKRVSVRVSADYPSFVRGSNPLFP